MNVFKRGILFITCFILFNFIFLSCNSDEPEYIGEGDKNNLVLIYAVAANNLQYNLDSDMNEILTAAPQLDLINNKVLVYYVKKDAICQLTELVYNKEKATYEFKEIGPEFRDLPLSTSVERIREVIEYVDENYDYSHMGLILWSHATGWIPWFGGSTPRRAFGRDEYDNNVYQTNITDLAEAIPEGIFDYIWFDCCYMANIETLYELKDKAPVIVGSVLEVPADGMPYHLTMPYLVNGTTNLKGAAQAFFDYYNEMDSRYIAASISIVNTSELQRLAEVCRYIFFTGGKPNLSIGIQNYSRLSGSPFYDMEQLLDSYTTLTVEDAVLLAHAMDNAVVFKLITDHDFNGKFIDTKKYSGLSIHNYNDANNDVENYYKELSWFKVTRN